MTSVTPLTRLASLREVAAAFVFNANGEILAREVPEKYSDADLQRLSAKMSEISALLEETKEYLLDFEHFKIWVRRFGRDMNYYLAAFIERDTDTFLLRQPINLAVLNLEKIIQQINRICNLC